MEQPCDDDNLALQMSMQQDAASLTSPTAVPSASDVEMGLNMSNELLGGDLTTSASKPKLDLVQLCEKETSWTINWINLREEPVLYPGTRTEHFRNNDGTLAEHLPCW